MRPHLVPVVDSDPFLFLSGQLALDSDMRLVPGDIEAQARQIIANIAQVLRPLGLSLDDVVKTTVWIKNAADFAKFDAVYARVFGAHKPARSTVVSDLVLPGALVEIEAIARRSVGATGKN